MKQWKNKGFTLVELIIVVAVIAVLAAVLSPYYLKYVERAREANDIQVANSLLKAATTAVLDPQNVATHPSSYYVFEWRTGQDIDALRNTSAIAYGVGYDSTGGEGISVYSFNYASFINIEPPHWSYEGGSIAADICAVMGWTNTISATGTNVQDAESEAGNEMNFRFAVHAETSEIIILNEDGVYDADNPWVELLGY